LPADGGIAAVIDLLPGPACALHFEVSGKGAGNSRLEASAPAILVENRPLQLTVHKKALSRAAVRVQH
jgi:hypothetical protein